MFYSHFLNMSHSEQCSFLFPSHWLSVYCVLFVREPSEQGMTSDSMFSTESRTLAASKCFFKKKTKNKNPVGAACCLHRPRILSCRYIRFKICSYNSHVQEENFFSFSTSKFSLPFETPAAVKTENSERRSLEGSRDSGGGSVFEGCLVKLDVLSRPWASGSGLSAPSLPFPAFPLLLLLLGVSWEAAAPAWPPGPSCSRLLLTPVVRAAATDREWGAPASSTPEPRASGSFSACATAQTTPLVLSSPPSPDKGGGAL